MSSNIRFLYLIKPISSLIPEVPQSKIPVSTISPHSQISFKDKMLWTSVTLFIYLICCQIPIYGVARSSGSDPLYWIRVILASNRGTLMELGISPLVTSSMILQFM